MRKRENLIGKKFSKLTPIKPGEDYISPSGSHYAQWWCKCDCGNPELVLVRGIHLKNGHTKSCGCFHKEVARQNGLNNKRFNKYDLSGEYGISWTNNTNKEFYFDLEDYDKIKNYGWYENNAGYIVAHNGNKTIRLNRLVMDCDENGNDVDHIKHNLYDNRKILLRICTHQKNSFNSKKPINNTSGITGVSYDKNRNKWVAEIRINNKKIFLGRFNCKEDAVKIRKDAEKKYFGEYSYDSSMGVYSISDVPDMEEAQELIQESYNNEKGGAE